MLNILTAAIGAFLLLAQAAVPVSAADNWPSRAIKLVVPFSPGGSTDVTARVLADGLRPVLGQPSVKAHFAEADKEQVGSSPAEFKQFIATEVERLRMQVRISGARIE